MILKRGNIAWAAASYVLGACLISPANGSDKNLETFSSKAGFSIKYPASWFRINAAPGNLTLISSKNREEGAVIPRGSQMISVREIEPINESDIASTYKSKNPDDEILSISNLNFRDTDARACAKITIIKSKDEIAPKVYYVEDHMYCYVSDRLFVLTLDQWDSDRYDEGAYRLSINILRSVKVHKQELR